METLLTLARHGQTRENAEGRWQGVSDSPLTAEGRRQAEALGARLKGDAPYGAIYTSPLGRAVETAHILAPLLGAPVIRREPDLREYDFGAWDGLTPAELRERGFWAAVGRDPEYAPPSGEGFGAAARRVAGALHRIAIVRPGERVVVVGHGLALAAALALLLDEDPRQAPKYALANGGVAEISVGSTARLVHLDPVASCELD